MKTRNLIAIETLCSHYEIEASFFEALQNFGLLRLEVYEKGHYIPEEQISDLEKMIRLHHDLQVNFEGIDVVLNLLEKEKELREEINELKNRLARWESFDWEY